MLYYNSAFDIAMILGTAMSGRGREQYHIINDKYYVETERTIREATGLIEISEPEFLRLRANWLESKKSKGTGKVDHD